jgi:hypothetical protein
MNPQVFNSSNLEVLTRLSKKLSYLEISSAGYFGNSLLTALPKAQNLRVLKVLNAKMSLLSVTKALSFCPQLQIAEFDAVQLTPVNSRAMWPQLQIAEFDAVQLTPVDSRAMWPQLDSLISLRLREECPLGSLRLVCMHHVNMTTSHCLQRL